MTADWLLVIGLACLAAALIAALLLWLDARVDGWEDDERDAFDAWTHGRMR
jgi:hypothetical protein